MTAPDAVPTGEGGLSELLARWTNGDGHGPLDDWYASDLRDAIAVERDRNADLLARAHAAGKAEGQAEGAAEALANALLQMEATISDGDVAEVAAPVTGEVGRSSAIARRDDLYNDPSEWLRTYIDQHDTGYDRHVVDDWYDAGAAETAERIAVAIEAIGVGPEPFCRAHARIARAEGATDE